MNAPGGVSFRAKRDPRQIRVIATKSMDSATLSEGQCCRRFHSATRGFGERTRLHDAHKSVQLRNVDRQRRCGHIVHTDMSLTWLQAGFARAWFKGARAAQDAQSQRTPSMKTTELDLEVFRAAAQKLPADGPVFMLNLLRYRAL
jgi:hypothetical protein